MGDGNVKQEKQRKQGSHRNPQGNSWRCQNVRDKESFLVFVPINARRTLNEFKRKSDWEINKEFSNENYKIDNQFGMFPNKAKNTESQ